MFHTNLFQSNFIEWIHRVLDTLCDHTHFVWPYSDLCNKKIMVLLYWYMKKFVALNFFVLSKGSNMLISIMQTVQH